MPIYLSSNNALAGIVQCEKGKKDDALSDNAFCFDYRYKLCALAQFTIYLQGTCNVTRHNAKLATFSCGLWYNKKRVSNQSNSI